MASSTSGQLRPDLFAAALQPPGFAYAADFLTPADERELVHAIADLRLQAARYRTFLAKRRIASFGMGYDFTSHAALPAPPLPTALHPLRVRAAAWAGVAADQLVQCTVAEYAAGTQLGWHRDVPLFGLVVGISLASTARMRFRPYPHVKHDRASTSLLLEPRSIYLLRDQARWRWQHAIAPTVALRYSITFRTLRSGDAA